MVVGLVLCEIALRVCIGSSGVLFGQPLPPFGAVTHPRQVEWLAAARAEDADPRAKGLAPFDVELGWTIRPGYVSADGAVHTNTIGARGLREYDARPTPGVLRVVCVGDSFTWGDQVEDSATFEARLEALDARVEAINLGVSAYGTDQALLRCRRDGLRLGGHVVVLGLMLENIGRNVNRYRPLWYPKSGSTVAKPRFVLSGGKLELVPSPFASQAELLRAVDDGSVLAALREHEYWSGRPELGGWGHLALARCVGAWMADREREVSRLWADPSGEPFRVTLALVAQLKREAIAGGARAALVLVLPRENDLEELVQGRRPFWQTLLDELDAEHIAWVDPGPELAALQKEARAHGGSTIYVGGHLSRAANEVVAAALLGWLKRAGQLPPP